MVTGTLTANDVFYRKAYSIIKSNGMLTLYRGYWATFNRDVFPLGLYFFVYHTIKDYYIKTIGKFESFSVGLAGAISGMAAWVICYPFDTVKTIIQTSDFKEKAPSQFTLFKDLISDKNGIFGVYRGATPSLILYISGCGFIFLFFEAFQKLFKPFTIFK